MVIAVAMFYLIAQNLLLTNQHLYQFVRYGSPRTWTDAIYSLSERLGGMRASPIVIDDWGMHGPLALLQRGRLSMIIVDKEFLLPSFNEAQRNYDRALLETGLWVGHTPAHEEIVGTSASIVQAAALEGFRKELIEVVSDRQGRAVFEIFRFREAH